MDQQSSSSENETVAVSLPVEETESYAISNENPSVVGTGLKTSLHGDVFQLKILTLFLVRGINLKYKFELTTEMPGLGGKFDDLVFKYQANSTDMGYLYLQAKHKQDESIQIKADQLLKDDDNDYSLAKYFRSYCHDIKKRTHASLRKVQNCIVFTNIGIHKDSFNEKGIELVEVPPPLTHHPNGSILDFDNGKKTTVWYKFKSGETDKLGLCQIMKEWSDIPPLARKLFDIVSGGKKLELRNKFIKSYLVSLYQEKVIVKEGDFGRFHADFLNGTNIQRNSISKFRETLANLTFLHFSKRLSFPEKSKRQVNQKQLKDFDEELKSIQERLDKKMEWEKWVQVIFSQYCDDLFKHCQTTMQNKKKMLEAFKLGRNLSTEAATFRQSLCNFLLIHYLRDLKFQLSKEFGQSHQEGITAVKSLDDSLGVREEDISEFIDKFRIADTPNEVELGKILNKEVGKYYHVLESDFQSSYILEKMLDWFKEKNSTWYTSVKGEKLLKEGRQRIESFRATSLSLDYQKTLNDILSFNDGAIEDMKTKLEQPVSFNPGKVLQVTHIVTPSPKLTAVKVIAALKRLNFDREDSYLVTSSSRLKEGHEKEWILKSFIINNKVEEEADVDENPPNRILIVVCDEGIVQSDNIKDASFLLSNQDETKSLKGKRILIIDFKGETEETSSSLNDTITCGPRSDDSSDSDGDSDDALSSQEKTKSSKEKRLMITGKDKTSINDTITYEQLSDQSDHGPSSKEALDSKTVSFQRDSSSNGIDMMTVAKLIGDDKQHGYALDAPSIEELMCKVKGEIQIPSYSATSFERSLYIKRQILFYASIDDTLWEKIAASINEKKETTEPETSADQLKNQCKIEPNTGVVKWAEGIDEKLKKKIWATIIAESAKIVPPHKISDDEFLNGENCVRRTVIISGVAGTGKSTVLSHFYKEIKKKDPSTWVIRIKLMDYQEALKEFSPSAGDGIFQFLFKIGVVGDISMFARSLLEHRLKTGHRLVLMLDGFDEINSACQKKATQIMNKTLDDMKFVRLYVTTRLHMADELQYELGQLAYRLKHFEEGDQITCMTSYWISQIKREITDNKGTGEDVNYINHLSDYYTTIIQNDANRDVIKKNEKYSKQVKKLQELAKSIVKGLSNNTNHPNEKSVIGIPLQCRILAECFLKQAQSSINNFLGAANTQSSFDEGTATETPASDIVDSNEMEKLNLASLYRKLMKVKREIYLDEKTNIHPSTVNPIVKDSLDFTVSQVEFRLTELAVQMIVSNQMDIETMWTPPINPSQSRADRSNQVSKLNNLCFRFGLVDQDNSASNLDDSSHRLQFLHRTYAEYLVAEHLYKGFHLEDDKHNLLLENEAARQFIVDKVLTMSQYDGVRHFLDSMLEETVDDVLKRQTLEKSFTNLLPERLQLFSKCLTSRLKEHTLQENPLTVNAKSRNNAIFQFICYGLDAEPDKLKKIQFIIHHIFLHVDDVFFEQKNDPIYKRMVEYYDGFDEVKQNELIRKFLGFYHDPKNIYATILSTKQMSLIISALNKIVKIQSEIGKKSFEISSHLKCIQVNLNARNWEASWKKVVDKLSNQTMDVVFVQGMYSCDFSTEKLPNTYRIVYNSAECQSLSSNQRHVGFAAIIVRRCLDWDPLTAFKQEKISLECSPQMMAAIDLSHQTKKFTLISAFTFPATSGDTVRDVLKLFSKISTATNRVVCTNSAVIYEDENLKTELKLEAELNTSTGDDLCLHTKCIKDWNRFDASQGYSFYEFIIDLKK